MRVDHVFDEEEAPRSLESSSPEPLSRDEAAALATVNDEAVELDMILRRLRRRSTAHEAVPAGTADLNDFEGADSLEGEAKESVSSRPEPDSAEPRSQAVAQAHLGPPADSGRRILWQDSGATDKASAHASEPNRPDLLSGDESLTALDIPGFLDEPVDLDARADDLEAQEVVAVEERASTFGDVAVGWADIGTTKPSEIGEPEQTARLDTPLHVRTASDPTPGVTVIDLRRSAPTYPSMPPVAEKRNPIGLVVVLGGAALIVLSVVAYVLNSHRSGANDAPVVQPTVAAVADGPGEPGA